MGADDDDWPEYGPSREEVSTRLMARHPAGVDYPMAQAYAGGLMAQRCIEIAGTLDQHTLRQVASHWIAPRFTGAIALIPARAAS